MTPELRSRLQTGFAAAALAIAAILVGGAFLRGLTALLFVMASFEYYRVTTASPNEGNGVSRFERYVLFALSVLPALGFLARGESGLFFSLRAEALGILALTVFFAAQREISQQYLVASALGYLFCGVVGSSILIIPDRFGSANEVLWLVAVVAASDIGAYFGGKRVGGPKLAPTLSPNKTISGSVCGMFASIAVSTLLTFAFKRESTIVEATFVGLYISLLAQLGDLCGSSIKRMYGVKDFGAILPGHGGVLDRIGALMFAAEGVLLLG